MAIRFYKPTSPGRRGMSTQDFGDITKGTPEKSLLEHKPAQAGRNNYGRITSRFRSAAATRSATARSTSSGTRPACRRRSLGDRVRPEPLRAYRADPVPGRREGVHPGAAGSASAIRSIAANSADIKPGNTLPLRFIPVGTDVHAVELKVGARRAGRPLGRHEGHADGEGGRLGDAAHAVGRDAARPHRVPRDDRPDRQHRARATSSGARPVAGVGSASARTTAACR